MGDFDNPNENNKEQQPSNLNAEQSQQQPELEQTQNDQPLYQQPLYQQPLNQQPLNQQPQYQQSQYQQSGQSQNQGQYQQYQQYQQPPRKDNGMAIASMVCGIVSFVISCCLYYLALPLAIVSIVLAIMVLKNNKGGKGMAIAGLVLSGITVLIALLAIIGCAAIAGNEEFLNEIYEQIETTTY
jgi:hypothetical protein